MSKKNPYKYVEVRMRVQTKERSVFVIKASNERSIASCWLEEQAQHITKLLNKHSKNKVPLSTKKMTNQSPFRLAPEEVINGVNKRTSWGIWEKDGTPYAAFFSERTGRDTARLLNAYTND